MKTWIIGISAAVLLVVASLSWAHWRFGSITHAVAWINGQKIQVDNPVRDLGTVDRDKEIKVEFGLINLGKEPMKIVGANVSCACILPPHFPIVLEPFATTPITFNLTSPSKAEPIEQTINLYIDGDVPALQLKITGMTQ